MRGKKTKYLGEKGFFSAAKKKGASLNYREEDGKSLIEEEFPGE